MQKKISVVGIGKLGLCFSLNLERKGYEIIGVDINEDYVESLRQKSFKSSEPFVNEYLCDSKNIHFTTSMEEALKNDIIFIVVQTPSTPDNKYDHTKINQIVEQLKKISIQKNRKDLIINCTTFPGYCENLAKELEGYNIKISYNPEFIAQGSIIRDQVMADNVLIGEADEYAGDLIEAIYKDLCEKNPSINRMSVTEAEITKLSVNCFLTTKISFANMIGDIAERFNCNSDIILSAIGTDSRIGSKYLKPGFGFGGPCFPRDNKALAACAEIVGINAIISKATDEMNKLHLEYQVEDFIKKNPDKSIPVDIEYVTYKKESTIIEESQQLKFAIELHNLGYNIRINEKRSEVLNQIKDYFK